MEAVDDGEAMFTCLGGTPSLCGPFGVEARVRGLLIAEGVGVQGLFGVCAEGPFKMDRVVAAGVLPVLREPLLLLSTLEELGRRISPGEVARGALPNLECVATFSVDAN